MKNYFKQLLTALLLFIGTFSYAQDMIYRINGSSIQAVNVEIQSEKIKYQKFNAATGPFYTIQKDKVASIVFADGTRQDMQEIEVEEDEARKPDPFFEETGNQQSKIGVLEYNRSVGFNFAGLVARQIEFDFEYRFKNTLVGLSTPVIVNMQPDFLTTPNDFGLNFSGGLDVNFFIWKENLDNTYYELLLGLGLDGGQSTEFINDTTQNITGFYSVYLTAGARIYAGKNISFALLGRLGARNYMDGFYTDIEPIIRPHVRIRYHF